MVQLKTDEIFNARSWTMDFVDLESEEISGDFERSGWFQFVREIN